MKKTGLAVLLVQLSASGHLTKILFINGGDITMSTYTIYIRLIGKRVVDFIVVLIELFSLAVMAKTLRANIE